MAEAWKCSTCDTMVTQPFCPGCGAGKPKAIAQVSPATVAIDPYGTFDYCAWTTVDRETGEERQCQMLATSWDQPYNTRDTEGHHCRKGYCHWHTMARETRGLARNFGRFKAFVEDQQAHKVCTQFTHHPPEYTFRALQGFKLPLAERLLVTPCEAGACFAHDALDKYYRRLDEEKLKAEGKDAEDREPELVEPEKLQGMIHKLAEQLSF